MKRIICMLVSIITILVFTSCGEALHESQSKSSLFEESTTQSTSVSTPESKPALTPEPTLEPTPEPTPQKRFITAYEEMKEGDRAEMESRVKKLINSRAIELYEEYCFQPVGIYGDTFPSSENCVGSQIVLDSVHVLSEGAEPAEFENRILMLFEVTLRFGADRLGNQFTLYVSTYTDDVFIGENGLAEFDIQNTEIDLVLSSRTYSFYDLYEDAVFAKEPFYTINSIVYDANHDSRMNEVKQIDRWLASEEYARSLNVSREYVAAHIDGYPDTYLTLKDGGNEMISYSSMRKLVEADIRMMNEGDLEMALAELYARNGGSVEDVQFDTSVFSDIEAYNVDFLKHHIVNFPIIKSPRTISESTSTIIPEPTPESEEVPAEEQELQPQEDIEPAFDPVGIWSIDSYKMDEKSCSTNDVVRSYSADLIITENGNFTLRNTGDDPHFYGTWKPYNESKLYAKLKNSDTEEIVTVYFWEEPSSTGRNGIVMEIENSGSITYWKWFV
mgnify:CR=1 FL=1